jgi:hypothetical protein
LTLEQAVEKIVFPRPVHNTASRLYAIVLTVSVQPATKILFPYSILFIVVKTVVFIPVQTVPLKLYAKFIPETPLANQNGKLLPDVPIFNLPVIFGEYIVDVVFKEPLL